MINFGEKLKKERTEKGLTQKELADKIGVKHSSISNWETNLFEPNIKAIQDLCRVLDIKPNKLMGSGEDEDLSFNNIRPITTQKVPLLGTVAAGEPIFAEEDLECYIEVGTDINCDYCLRVKGQSMINARIFDGDIVFVKKQSDVDNAQIAVVLIENDATLKRVFKFKNRIELRAENPTFPVLYYENEELEQIRILGRAVAFQSCVR